MLVRGRISHQIGLFLCTEACVVQLEKWGCGGYEYQMILTLGGTGDMTVRGSSSSFFISMGMVAQEYGCFSCFYLSTRHFLWL